MSVLFALVGESGVTEFPIGDLSLRFPNSSFPANITSQSELPDGLVMVRVLPHPDHNPSVEKVSIKSAPEFVAGEWVVGFDVNPLSDVEKTRATEVGLFEAKARRQVAIDSLVVTAQSGKTFDGNEDAQNRMSRAITAMEDTDTLPWVLADNTIALVSRAELKEALKLAGAAMAEIWVQPYLTVQPQ